MIIIGIDPGTQGGICVLEDGKILNLCTIPFTEVKWGNGKRNHSVIDVDTLYNNIIMRLPYFDMVYIEEQLPFGFRDSAMGAFTIGYNYGTIINIIDSEFRYVEVLPKIWQCKILGEKIPKGKTKEYALDFAKKQWPDESFLRTDRCKKPHDGLIDAACIAYYGYLEEKGE